jgi:hypothetical protein
MMKKKSQLTIFYRKDHLGRGTDNLATRSHRSAPQQSESHSSDGTIPSSSRSTPGAGPGPGPDPGALPHMGEHYRSSPTTPERPGPEFRPPNTTDATSLYEISDDEKSVLGTKTFGTETLGTNTIGVRGAGNVASQCEARTILGQF